MKPSEELEAAIEKLIRDDYVRWGGNRYSAEMWQDRCAQHEIIAEYRWVALKSFLDKEPQ